MFRVYTLHIHIVPVAVKYCWRAAVAAPCVTSLMLPNVTMRTDHAAHFQVVYF